MKPRSPRPVFRISRSPGFLFHRHRRLYAAFFLGLWILCPSPVFSQDPPPLPDQEGVSPGKQTHIARYLELRRAGKFAEAAAEMEAVIRLDPGDADAWYSLGETYRRLGKWDKVIGAFQKTVALNPGHQKAHLRIGQFYEAQQEWEKAKSALEKAAALNRESPEGKESAQRLANVERQIGILEKIKGISGLIEHAKFDEALSEIQALSTLAPDHPMIFYLRGLVADFQKRPDDAIRDMERARELEPRDPMIAARLGIVYQKSGDLDRSIPLFKEVIARGKADDEAVKLARDWLAAAQTALGAKEAMAQARSTLKEGGVAGAQKTLEEAIRLNPKDVTSHISLAALFQSQGETAKALEILRQAAARSPDSYSARLQLGIFLEQVGSLDEARIEFEKVLYLSKGTGEATLADKHLRSVKAKQHFQEGQRLVTTGDFQAALREIQEVISLSPDDPSAYLSQGVIYDRMNRPEEAIRALEKALELDPKYANAWFQLAVILESQGRFDDAKKDYETVLTLNPDPKTAEKVRSLLSDIGQRTQLYEGTRRVRDLFEAAKFEESLQETEELIALNPSNFLAYFYRGMDLAVLKRPLEAVAAYQKALEVQPKSFSTRISLGQVYMDEGRFEEARDEYERVIREGEGTREADFARAALQKLRVLSFSLNYGQTLDSNVAQGSAAVQSVYSSLKTGVDYILTRDKKKRLTANGSASQTIYLTTQAVANNLSGALSGQYRPSSRWTLSGNLNVNYGFFDQVRSSRSRGLSLTASGRGDRIPTSLTLRYAFTGARSYRSASGDADSQEISVSGFQQLTGKDGAGVTGAFTTYANLDKLGSNLAYRSNGLTVQYVRDFSRNVSGNFNGNLTYYRYANPDSTQLFRRFRQTFQYGFGGGLNFPISDRMNVSVNYTYVTSNTNLPQLTSKAQQDLADILAQPIPMVGGDFDRHTVVINYSVTF